MSRIATMAFVACAAVVMGGASGKAACSAKCIGFSLFTTFTSSTDTTGGFYHTSMGMCSRHVFTLNGDDYTTNVPVTVKYRKLSPATCTVTCYANGGIFGTMSCTSYTEKPEELSFTCYTGCSTEEPH
jgi:hypothetical protein